MIPFSDAFKISMDAVFRLDTERVSLAQANQRVLAEDVISDVDMPLFNKSSVDGYACRKEDLSQELELIEIIPAGKYPEKNIGPGQCAKIMTGAPVPQGANWVVMVEFSEETSGGKIRFSKAGMLPNIALQGEDVNAGDQLIPAGVIINPGHIGIMASAGYAQPLVSRLPRMAVISTGDELIEPEHKPERSQIRNSNAYQLMAQAGRMGIQPEYIGIVGDNEESTLAFLKRAQENNDVILFTGGVSMGDFDFVPAIMKQAGFELLFEKIAIQPGRPTVLARKTGQLCFGLPGNPVASFVLFELLVKPVLYAMMGHQYSTLKLRLPLGKTYRRLRSDRLNVIPTTISKENIIVPVEYHGSGHIHALASANAFIFVEPGITEIPEGTILDVRPI